MPISQTWVFVERKGLKCFDSGGVAICIRGTFDLVVFNVILRPFGALVSKWPVTRKWLAVERNGLKVETRG